MKSLRLLTISMLIAALGLWGCGGDDDDGGGTTPIGGGAGGAAGEGVGGEGGEGGSIMVPMGSGACGINPEFDGARVYYVFEL